MARRIRAPYCYPVLRVRPRVSGARRAGLRISGILSAVVVVCLALSGAASADFAFKDCGSTAFRYANPSLTPDPITGSGAAILTRWEVTYDPLTNAILDSEFDFGAPLGAVLVAGRPVPVLRFPDAGNVIGSATYDGLPQTPSVLAGFYPFPAAGVTVDGVTVNGQFTFLKDIDNTVANSLTVTLEKKELGTWVEIPGISYQNINDLGFLTPGDYYLKAQAFDDNGDTSVCTELYFTDAQGATAPIAFRVPPGSALAATLVTASTRVGPGKALAHQAAAIQAAVDAEDTAGACADISDYLGLVKAQTGRHLSQSTATKLTNDATSLATALGCVSVTHARRHASHHHHH